MAATSGYQAGFESNDAVLSYGLESVWGTAPATTFQAVRTTGESLSGSKTRSRPQEINPNGEVSANVTTQETAGGGMNFGLSYGTFDDWISSCMCSDWQAAQAINGVSGDIALANVSATTCTLVSTTANKFQNLALGDYIRLLGFTNAGNNGYWRITTYTDTTHITLTGITLSVTETPAGTAAKIRGSRIQNGVTFKSVYIQKLFSSSAYLVYPGSYISQATFSAQMGQFISGSFTVLSQNESFASTDSSTGGVVAAPTGDVSNPVGNFKSIRLDDVSIAASVDQVSIQLQRTGAAQEYALGSAAAVGILKGQMQVTGSIRMFFKDSTYYARYKAETRGRLAIIIEDSAANAYVFVIPSCALMNPKVNAAGVNQAVMATFDIEGNPQTGGGTIQIYRLPST